MPGRGASCTALSFVLQPCILSITVWVRGRFGHQRATGVASFVQKYGAEQDMGRGEIIVPARAPLCWCQPAARAGEPGRAGDTAQAGGSPGSDQPGVEATVAEMSPAPPPSTSRGLPHYYIMVWRV